MTDYWRGVRFDCHDCGHNTAQLRETYMVAHHLWDEAARQRVPTMMLCVGCIESRIGRRLAAEDFIDCPLNHQRRRSGSLRLRSRLSKQSAPNA